MASHWCHLCSQMVGVDHSNNCLICGQGFIEERVILFTPPPSNIFTFNDIDAPNHRVDPTDIITIIRHLMERRDITNILNRSFEESQPNKTATSKAFIDELGDQMLSDKQLADSTCSICMEDFKRELKGTPLPCGHIYHKCCIEDWLKIDHVCPICRSELPTADMPTSTRIEVDGHSSSNDE